MSGLSQILEEVRRKIAQYQGKEMNEQNTKTALIDPVLRALGWDVGNLEEVSQEYKRQPRDKPVDYALFLLRTPKLFVEAKSLGQNLDDRRWANQIMGYALVTGVKWTVITNGDEYRIYNACVDVPVEEKLFRVVRVTAQGVAAEETLALLSKDRIRDNDIEILWKAHFVDRQVRAALEQLFSPDPDSALTRLVKRRVRDLSPKEIRASLARVRALFDFPVEPDLQDIGQGKARKHDPARSLAAKEAWKTRRGKTQDSEVTHSVARIENVGTAEKFYCRAKDANATGVLTNDGFVVQKGSVARLDIAASAQKWGTGIVLRKKLQEGGVLKEENGHLRFTRDYLFRTPSAAAVAVMGRSANGWTEWKDSQGRTLQERQAHVRRKAK